MPVVPTSLIAFVLLVAFFPSASGFFLRIPKNPLLGKQTLLMVACAAVMIFALGLDIAAVQIVWLSWVLLAIAIIIFGLAIPAYRSARATRLANEARNTERRARGR